MNWPMEDILKMQSMVARVTKTGLMPVVRCQMGSGLHIRCENGEANIVAEDKTALARGLFLAAMARAEGKQALAVDEERGFASCGAFIDCSRGAVMTVEACKRYIDAMAALGMNLLVLYTEETYTVPEFPYFGYLRGRYTQEELRAIDDYAFSMGVELVPCIQTLAHLGQFLQWGPSERLKDTQYCLLIDEPETYQLIEAEIRSIRACVRTRRLHIGMDEAHGVGLGQYYAKHGPTDRFEMLNRHLGRVVDICRQYGFAPFMWSDMFFRLGSKTNEYYDPTAEIPQAAIDGIPDVGLCYWDYYHQDPAVYEYMLTQHEKMGRPTQFAGGVWTWAGFLPNFAYTRATMRPALAACLAHGVSTVMATMWGDDANETDYLLALGGMPLFSEYCWRGGVSDEEMDRMGSFLTGLPAEALQAFSLFHADDEDLRAGKALVYADLLYPLLEGRVPLDMSIKRFERARALLAPHLVHETCQYADTLFAIALEKAQVVSEIRERYQAGDTAYLRRVAEESIPHLLTLYDRLIVLHRAQWEGAYKRNGWERIVLRYGAVKERLRDVQYALLRYANGALPALCEMEEPLLDATRRGNMQWYDVYVTPQM